MSLLLFLIMSFTLPFRTRYVPSVPALNYVLTLLALNYVLILSALKWPTLPAVNLLCLHSSSSELAISLLFQFRAGYVLTLSI